MYNRTMFIGKKPAWLILLILMSFSRVWAQTTTNDPNMGSSQFDTTGFPQWAKDLRRGEIVAFGAFPFAYFFSNFGVDVYRSARNGWDSRYAPWPLTGAGAVDKTQDERFLTIGVAAGTAVLISLIDYGIVRYKKNRLQREISRLPEGTPIIIRRPLYEEDGTQDLPETGNP